MNAVELAATIEQSNQNGDYRRPPSLRWGYVSLFHMVTFGIFGMFWTFKQALWVRRIDPTSNALFVLVVAFILAFIPLFLDDETSIGSVRLLLNVSCFVSFAWAYLMMRAAIEARFDLNLSGLMTVFFHFLYLQYHLTRIAKYEHVPTQRRGLLH